MKLEELSWPEIKNYLESDQRLIIPVGTCEQHGEHLPLNTDTLVTEKIADFLSNETGIIIAPTISYGVNLPCDRRFFGTTNVSESLLRQFLSSVIVWWKEQGFTKFYVISAHGDPVHLKALREADPVSICVLDLYDFDIKGILTKQENIKHACEGETSVMMHLYPEKVRKENIKDFETPFEIFKDYLSHERTEPIKDSPGCQGYPSFANPDKGQKIFLLMKENALKWVKNN